jgi:hypothetical protein
MPLVLTITRWLGEGEAEVYLFMMRIRTLFILKYLWHLTLKLILIIYFIKNLNILYLLFYNFTFLIR